MSQQRFDYDVLVIGSGFGGSVSALRLIEKGYRVGVLEAGSRFTDSTLPKTSWRLRKFLWAPRSGRSSASQAPRFPTRTSAATVPQGGAVSSAVNA